MVFPIDEKVLEAQRENVAFRLEPELIRFFLARDSDDTHVKAVDMPEVRSRLYNIRMNGGEEPEQFGYIINKPWNVIMHRPEQNRRRYRIKLYVHDNLTLNELRKLQKDDNKYVYIHPGIEDFERSAKFPPNTDPVYGGYLLNGEVIFNEDGDRGSWKYISIPDSEETLKTYHANYKAGNKMDISQADFRMNYADRQEKLRELLVPNLGLILHFTSSSPPPH